MKFTLLLILGIFGYAVKRSYDSALKSVNNVIDKINIFNDIKKEDIINNVLNTALNSNYDYVKQAQVAEKVNEDFLETFKNWREDPKCISAYHAKSIGVYDEWIALMRKRVNDDPSYLTVEEQLGIGIVASDNLQNEINNGAINPNDPEISSYLTSYVNLKNKIIEMIESEPAAVSEYQARDVGLYEQWKEALEKRLAVDPDYLISFYEKDEQWNG